MIVGGTIVLVFTFELITDTQVGCQCLSPNDRELIWDPPVTCV